MKVRKMKSQRSVFAAVAAMVAILTPYEAFAAEGYTSPAQVLDFGPREVSIDIYMPGPASPMNCSNVGWYRLKTSAYNYDMIASFILTQFAQKAPVRLYVNACDGDGASIIVAARTT
jgi:hypothetical protein